MNKRQATKALDQKLKKLPWEPDLAERMEIAQDFLSHYGYFVYTLQHIDDYLVI